MLSDIKVPKVISLRVWIRQVGFGHSQNSFLDVGPVRGRIAKLLPVIKPTASDHVVDCGKCPVGMIQMTVQHCDRIIATCRDPLIRFC